MEIVIPPKKNRKTSRNYDKDVYENRYQVEKTFLKLKRWRGIATRYAKNTLSYIASIFIAQHVHKQFLNTDFMGLLQIDRRFGDEISK